MNKIYVVGIGPGNYELMTIKAANVLKECDCIIGYTVYVDLVKEHFADKEFLTTPMKKEVDRCVLAFEEARKGKTVSERMPSFWLIGSFSRSGNYSLRGKLEGAKPSSKGAVEH